MTNADTLRMLASATMDIDERDALYDGAGALEMRDDLVSEARKREDGLRTYSLEKALQGISDDTPADDVVKRAETFHVYLAKTSGAAS